MLEIIDWVYKIVHWVLNAAGCLSAAIFIASYTPGPPLPSATDTRLWLLFVMIVALGNHNMMRED
jgi:hypothetical protein